MGVFVGLYARLTRRLLTFTLSKITSGPLTAVTVRYSVLEGVRGGEFAISWAWSEI